MSKGQAGRPAKLSNWTLLNALVDGRKHGKSVRQVARELHVHPDTIYATAKRSEINIPLVLKGIPPKERQIAPSEGESAQCNESVEVAEPEPARVSCHVILGNGLPCPKPMPHSHVIGGSMVARRPAYNQIVMSYAPRRKSWEQ